ncbi:tetratricopeptide repeat-containing sensor histidine kinase [Flavobacteriaceae bacterium F89]|uniref:histidine kinase n=1 Tax=Cerina litoralis TaxID=2874477 RepID=A0AAE3EV04_9FLAO|nr:tetratricopeptide repeat-containing sensor histidine kinase [Cerina litoralis]MCG2461020.1 tetratricopeptide repeat-containing sensor histidine kinase [Cerina litoralis]
MNNLFAQGSVYKKLTITVVLLLGCLYSLQSQQRFRDSLRNSVRIMERSKNFSPKDTSYILTLNSWANEFRYYNLDSLLFISRQALDYSKEAGYKMGECLSYINLGDFHSDRGENCQAIEYYLRSLSMASSLGDIKLKLSVENSIAGEYGYLGNYGKALDGYLEAIELATKVDDKPMLSILNENIADLYSSQKDYDQALEFYKRVKKINDIIGDELYSAETMCNVASIYADMGNFPYALFNINKSIAIFENHKIMDWLAYSYSVKGKIYVKQKKYDWALHWYNQSNYLHEKLDDDRSKIELLNGMAEAYLGLKKDDISQRYALEAFEISKNIKFLEGIQKCSKTLYIIHKNKRNYARALEFHELFQQTSDTLARADNGKSLTMLQTKLQHDQQREDLILRNERALAKQWNYVYASLVILLILVIIIILIQRGKKIQKGLNTKLKRQKQVLLQRESELKLTNRTKDKLFSIIAHDLRGPIGALQDLLRLFRDGDIKKSEFLEYIPKLRNDVGHIAFTLNNLLSWGESQLKGAVTHPRTVPIENLVNDNINLLSEIANSKGIRFINKVPENTLSYVDGHQIDIVIRNLISNALKFTPENGTITIDAEESNNFWQVSVKDTGVGMDLVTQKNLFNKNNYSTTYGTNNEKGTGLGLSLSKEMVEKNKGKIWMESTMGKGTCFYFTVPKSEKKYGKAG